MKKHQLDAVNCSVWLTILIFAMAILYAIGYVAVVVLFKNSFVPILIILFLLVLVVQNDIDKKGGI